MQETKLILKLADVSKRYRGGNTESGERTILDRVNFRLNAGESAAIVGPSGVGKSTLLNIMGAVDRPSSGRVFLRGKDIAGLADTELARLRNRDIGLVFQDHHLLPQCTVMENVLLPTLVPGSPLTGKLARSTALRLLRRVGLESCIDQHPVQLSGGERQRVAVVRALINSPGLVLADEPTGALDHFTATKLGSLLIELNQEEGISLIVATHSMDLARRLDRIYLLRSGTIVAADEYGDPVEKDVSRHGATSS